MYVLSVQYSCAVVSVFLFGGKANLVLYTHFTWAGGTFFPVVLLCCVSFWFWWEKGFDLHTHVLLRVQYSCGSVLVFACSGK